MKRVGILVVCSKAVTMTFFTRSAVSHVIAALCFTGVIFSLINYNSHAEVFL